MRAVDITTRDGTLDAKLFHPEGAGPWPAVLMLTDIRGTRPVYEAMAERLVSAGYVVLLPNVYYREGRPPFAALQPSGNEETDRQRRMTLASTLTPERVESDAAAELAFLEKQKEVKGPRVGVVGYCMSGPMAIRLAAQFPERIAAAASYHGVRLASDAPDSPHRLLNQVRGELYFGHAEGDSLMPADAIARLEAAVKETGVPARSEVYVGARHGFAVEDSVAYNQEASERHWTTMLDLFNRTLKA